MKSKFIPALGVVTILFVAALIWMTNQFLLNDRQSFAETQSRTSVSAVAEVIESELRFVRGWVSAADSATLQKINWDQMGTFVYMARLQKNEVEWKILEDAVRPNLPLVAADRSLFVSDFNFQKKDQASDDFIQISSSVDLQKNSYVGYLLVRQGQYWLLAHQGESVQSLIDKQKLSRHTLSVVGLNSMVIAHCSKECVGQKMSSNSLIQKIISEQLPQGSGLFKMDKNQSQFAFYQRIPKTNAYVYSALSLSMLTDGQMSLWYQIAAFGLGFILILISLSSYFRKNEAEAMQPRQSLAIQNTSGVAMPKMPATQSSGPLQSTTNVPRPASAMLTADAAASQKERTQNYMKMASSLGHEMKAPLLNVLGFGQILLQRANSPEEKAMIESLLKEARDGKDIVEKLFTFAGEKTSVKSKTKMHLPLQKALRDFETKWASKKVKITKEIPENLEFDLDMESLSKAFENIFVNSVEALEKQAQKEIKIKLEENSDSLILTISDNGEGISADNLKKIFDPFFTTKKAGQHMGLGLSAAIGIFKEHNAEAQVQSEVGKGTTLKIIFSKLDPVESSLTFSKIPQPPVVQSSGHAPGQPTALQTLVATVPKPMDKVKEKSFAKAETKAEVKAEPLEMGPMPSLEIPRGETVTFSGSTKGTSPGTEVKNDSDSDSEKLNLDMNLDQLLSMPDAEVAAPPPPPAAAQADTPPVSAPLSLEVNMLAGANSQAQKKNELDDFKFSIRRPGKRTT